MIEWIFRNIFAADIEALNTALSTRNRDIIDLVHGEYDGTEYNRLDFSILWTGPPSQTPSLVESVLKIFEADNGWNEIIAAAAKAGDTGFLNKHRDDAPEMVLKHAIRHKMRDIYAHLSSPQEMVYAFEQFIENSMDDEAVAILPRIIDQLVPRARDTFIFAATHGCTKTLQFMSVNVRMIRVDAGLMSESFVKCLDDTCAKWFLSVPMVYNDTQYLKMLMASVQSQSVLEILLSRNERRNVRTLNPVLIQAIKVCDDNKLASTMFAILNQTRLCTFTDPEIMETAARSRHVQVIVELAKYGGNIEIAFMHSVKKNDSVTTHGLARHVSQDTLAKGICHAISVKNKRMEQVLKEGLITSS